jgi:hypothetical protein
VESRREKGLLYAGTDHGAFWVSRNDGAQWEEYSDGISNGYIRSISPSRHKDGLVYMAMTGLNYDDLNGYLYVSVNYGKTWKALNSGLPNEPVNVVLEDPSNGSILYAGTIRGVYVSVNYGKDWAYLGVGMPGCAIADLEIHEPTMDLVAATHGRGIYKINMAPIQKMASNGFLSSEDRIFPVAHGKTPWFNSFGQDPDHRTFEKVDVAFWVSKPQAISLSLKAKDNKEAWTVSYLAKEGFNQYRWDMIQKREASDFPYFTRYEWFVAPGKYTWQLKVGSVTYDQPWEVVLATSPYAK